MRQAPWVTIPAIGPAPLAISAAPRSAAAAFGMPAPAAPGGGAPGGGPAAAASASSLDAILALQEEQTAERVIPARDREARRRGQGLLTALAALQHALLDGGNGDAALRQLAALADGVPAATPQLEAVVRALSLRARIELARRGL